MKSQIVSVGGQPSCEYPVLKRSKPELCCGCDYVVLFTAPRKGVVVHVFEASYHGVAIGWDGSMEDGTSNGFGEAAFYPFNDTVQLFNA